MELKTFKVKNLRRIYLYFVFMCLDSAALNRNMNTTGVGSASHTAEYALEKYQMLRYEANAQVKIVMTSGTAEIFGTELVCDTDLVLQEGERGTVVTFHGCKITVKGLGLDAFVMDAVEDHDLLHVYVNIHANLQEARKKATEDQSRGPRVLVCGPENVGKSVLCRTLVNYAARRGSKPVLVDVNVGLNQVRRSLHFVILS